MSVTRKLTQKQQNELVKGLGDAIETIPGKDGRGLIVDMDDGKTLYAGGVKRMMSH